MRVTVDTLEFGIQAQEVDLGSPEKQIRRSAAEYARLQREVEGLKTERDLLIERVRAMAEENAAAVSVKCENQRLLVAQEERAEYVCALERTVEDLQEKLNGRVEYGNVVIQEKDELERTLLAQVAEEAGKATRFESENTQLRAERLEHVDRTSAMEVCIEELRAELLEAENQNVENQRLLITSQTSVEAELDDTLRRAHEKNAALEGALTHSKEEIASTTQAMLELKSRLAEVEIQVSHAQATPRPTSGEVAVTASARALGELVPNTGKSNGSGLAELKQMQQEWRRCKPSAEAILLPGDGEKLRAIDRYFKIVSQGNQRLQQEIEARKELEVKLQDAQKVILACNDWASMAKTKLKTRPVEPSSPRSPRSRCENR